MVQKAQEVTKLTAAIIKTVDFVYSSIKVSKDNPANKTFYASSGGVEISEWDEATNTIKATLTNAEFQEVTINDNTFVSTPVAGGETWCISKYFPSGRRSKRHDKLQIPATRPCE